MHHTINVQILNEVKYIKYNVAINGQYIARETVI